MTKTNLENTNNPGDIIEVEEAEKSPAQEWLDRNYPKDGTCTRKEQQQDIHFA